jgi:hypothetical protein
MSRNKKNTSPLTALNRDLRRPDLSILGDSIKVLPAAQWKSRMFFMGVPDTDLRECTSDRFPATLRPDKNTHPVFVLSTRPTGHLLCPCSSRGNKKRLRYVRKNCCLEMKNYTMKCDSFLIEHITFTLPMDSRFSRKLIFKGRVPENCICGGRQ